MRHLLLALAFVFALVLACAACDSSAPSAAADFAAPVDAAMAVDAAAAVDLGPAPTYANFAHAFFTSYCVRCHPSSTGSPRDFTQFSVIQQNAHDIACGVSPTALPGCSGNPAPAQFPIGNGPFPSDGERNRLVAWIQGGLPQ